MDWNSLTIQQVGLIAASATVISTVVAATAALVSTLVGSWNNRRFAREAALREYRLRLMAPALEEAELRLQGVNLVLIKGKPLSTLYGANKEPFDRKVFVTPSEELHDAALDFAMWDHWCWSVLTRHDGKPISAKQVTWMLDQIAASALTFREAVENFAFCTTFGFRLRRRLKKNRAAREQQLVKLLVQIEHRQAALGVGSFVDAPDANITAVALELPEQTTETSKSHDRADCASQNP